jgi:metallophosphoesterase superfamily enzyme
VLVGRGRQRERLPCFWLGRETGVLPAFGEFTGCAEVEPEDGDAVFVVADDEVMRFEARAP